MDQILKNRILQGSAWVYQWLKSNDFFLLVLCEDCLLAVMKKHFYLRQSMLQLHEDIA